MSESPYYPSDFVGPIPVDYTDTSPMSAAQPSTSGSNSAWSDILKTVVGAGLSYYVAKASQSNSPRSSASPASSSAQPILTGGDTSLVLPTSADSTSALSGISPLMLGVGAAVLIVIFMMMRR